MKYLNSVMILLVLLTISFFVANCSGANTDVKNGDVEVSEKDTNGEEENPVCPECGSEDVIPIVYGKPGTELIERADKGEVILGGCVISDDSPFNHCNGCEHEW